MLKKKIKALLFLILMIGLIYFILTVTSREIFATFIGNEKEAFVYYNEVNLSEDEMASHFHLPLQFKGRALPFHQIYEPRKVGFPLDMKKRTVSFNETKLLLFWTPWNNVRKTINYYFLLNGNESFVLHKCPISNCIVTQDRKQLQQADAVLFHLIDIDHKDLPPSRKPHQIWISYNLEAPWLVKKHTAHYIDKLGSFFNWTMSYRKESEVIVRYGFIKAYDNKIKKNFTKIFQKKTKNVVWFVSDCHTDSKREDYVKELQKYIEVDVYGSCGKLKCYPAQSSFCYDKILEKYKFYLSFENSICPDYVTEKFFNVYNYDLIPVTFGGSHYENFVPSGTYIDATLYEKPQKLAELLKTIGSNILNYNRYLIRKNSYRAYLDPWMCRLCEKLHLPTNTLIIKDVKKGWLIDSKCKRWETKTQKYVNATYT